MREINSIIIHCTDTESGTVESIRKFHMAPPPGGRGWDDIAYHFIILRDGTIENGRSPDKIGAHAYGHNEHSLGICLVGKDKFTLKQFLALRHLLGRLKEIYGIGHPGIYCHYELDNHGKTCPGFLKADLLNFIS